MNKFHFAAVWLFAIALPLLVVAADACREEPIGMVAKWRMRAQIAGVIGGGVFAGGIALLFHSFNHAIGNAFAGTLMAMFAFVALNVDRKK